jgi:nucleoside-diphosphate-sugar epimerase
LASIESEPVLVTGATGFIGNHLVNVLRRLGYRVVTHSGFDGDIAECELPFSGVKHVFHLAGLSFVPDSWDRPLDYYRTNLLGTVNVLEFCRVKGASLTFMSSYVYGQPLHLPIDENHPVRPLNPYSHTKLLAEEAVLYYGAQFGVRAATIRSFNTYGSGQAPQFLIPRILAQVLDPACGEIVVADTRPRRDFLYVPDLVALLIATMERHASGIFNSGSGESVSIAEILDIIWSLGLRRKPLRSENRPRVGDVLDVVADISKARRELEWAPRVSLRDGLAEMLREMGASIAL